MDTVESCRKCGKTPVFGSYCDLYFVVGNDECGDCGSFTIARKSIEEEIVAWNKHCISNDGENSNN